MKSSENHCVVDAILDDGFPEPVDEIVSFGMLETLYEDPEIEGAAVEYEVLVEVEFKERRRIVGVDEPNPVAVAHADESELGDLVPLDQRRLGVEGEERCRELLPGPEYDRPDLSGRPHAQRGGGLGTHCPGPSLGVHCPGPSLGVHCPGPSLGVQWPAMSSR